MNKIKISLMLSLSVLLSGCNDDNAFFFKKFNSDYKESIEKIEDTGLKVNLKYEKNTMGLEINGQELTDSQIIISGNKLNIKTWTLSCYDEYNDHDCFFRFRDGDQSSSNVLGLDLSQRNAQILTNTIVNHLNANKFIDFELDGLFYSYNEFGKYTKFKSKAFITSRENKLIIKPVSSFEYSQNDKIYNSNDFSIIIGEKDSEIFRKTIDTYYNLLIKVNNKKLNSEKSFFEWFE